MNRDILFRGKNTNGEWVQGSLVVTTRGLKYRPKQQTKTWIITSSFGNGGWFNVIGREYVYPNTVSEFTGLYDVNNKPIFEGDIVSYRGRKWIVSWIGEMSAFEMVDASGNHAVLRLAEEVVGNIHDKGE